MIDEEVMFKLEQERILAKVKPDLERALQSLNSTLHWLHETGEYESDLLDEVCSDVQDNIKAIEGLISE